MNLFPVQQPIMQEQYVIAPQIHTPLGTIQLSVSLSEQSLHPDRSYTLKNDTLLYVYHQDTLECELILCQLNPELPEGMSVEACWAAVFRLKPKLDGVIPECTFAANWQEGYTWTDYGSDTGQNLEAAQYSNEAYRLHLGTQDRDMLMLRRDQGDGVPLSFGQDMHGIRNADSKVWSSKYGLQVPMTTIAAGELCQIHFVVAWSRMVEDDASTWFAVDQLTESIVEAAGL